MPNCNRHNSASVMSMANSMFIIQLLISTPILLLVLLWHSTWWWESLLPYVYAQINGYCYYHYPEYDVWTHTSTYGYTRAVFGDLYSVAVLGWLYFRCPGYFITHLVISIPPTHFKTKKNISTQNGVWPARLCCQPSTASTVCIVRLCATLSHATHSVT